MTSLSKPLKTAAFALACTLTCLLSADAQGLLLGSRPNVLGNANQFGYARIVKDLGSLPLNEERNLPVALVFSSDPSVKPGLLGPGWSLPLFDSTAYRSRRGVLVWDSPDEYRRFFVIDSSADVRRDENGYVSQKIDWRAVEHERRGSIQIRSVKDPEQMFEYRDGQLYEFCYGAGTVTFAVEYDGRGNLKRVFDRSSQRTVMEVRYSGTDVQAIMIGDQAIEVAMGDGDWTAPDGKVNYRNYRVSFLLRLGSESECESFTYTKDQLQHRAAAPGQSLSVNRLTVEQDERKSWLSYEAQSGFMVADSGGEYTVINPAYDPFVEAGKGQPRVSPRLVKVTRKPSSGGEEQMWSRDWPKGIETFTEPDGKLTRQTWIMAKGPAYGKLRRIEEQVGGKWAMLKTLTYRPDGKLLREIDAAKSVRQYSYAENGNLLSLRVNGDLRYFAQRSSDGTLHSVISNTNGNTVEQKLVSKAGGSSVILVGSEEVNYELVLNHSDKVKSVKNIKSRVPLFNLNQ